MTVEEPATALSVGLSPEELSYFLDRLNLPTLPGVDRQPLAQLSPEQQSLVRAVTQRGLVARGMLLSADDGHDPGALDPNPLLLAMLAANAAPEHSLLVWRQASSEAGRMYYGHSWEDVHVLRWLTDQGIHQFLLFSSREAYVTAVTRLVEVTASTAGNGQAHHLPGEQFEQAQTAAGDAGASAAAALLQAAGLAPETAAALAADMAAPRTLLSVLGTHHTENAAPGLAFTAITGRALTWLADYETAAEPQITLRQAAPGEIEQRVRAFIASA